MATRSGSASAFLALRFAIMGRCPGSFRSNLILELRVLDAFTFLHFEFFESEGVYVSAYTLFLCFLILEIKFRTAILIAIRLDGKIL